MSNVSTVFAPLIAQLVAHQGEVVAVVSAFLFAWLSRKSPWFAGLGNWTKRAVLFIVAAVVCLIVAVLGFTPTIDLGEILVSGLFSAGTAGSVAKAANKTPSTEEESKAMQEAKKFDDFGRGGQSRANAIGAVAALFVIASLAIVLGAVVQSLAVKP